MDFLCQSQGTFKLSFEDQFSLQKKDDLWRNCYQGGFHHYAEQPLCQERRGVQYGSFQEF